MEFLRQAMQAALLLIAQVQRRFCFHVAQEPMTRIFNSALMATRQPRYAAERNMKIISFALAMKFMTNAAEGRMMLRKIFVALTIGLPLIDIAAAITLNTSLQILSATIIHPLKIDAVAMNTT
jgi:hypothetical protein